MSNKSNIENVLGTKRGSVSRFLSTLEAAKEEKYQAKRVLYDIDALEVSGDAVSGGDYATEQK